MIKTDAINDFAISKVKPGFRQTLQQNVASSTTPNPRTKFGLTILPKQASKKNERESEEPAGEIIDNYRGSLNPKRWRPSYDTSEISDIIKMQRETGEMYSKSSVNQQRNRPSKTLNLSRNPMSSGMDHHF